MKRVVFLKSRANFRGGLEKYTHFLIKAFLKKGCVVTLLTTGEKPSIADVEVHSLAADSKFTLYHLIHFDSLCRKWIKKNPHDIVFGMERTTCQTHYRAGSGVHAHYLKQRALIDPYWKQLTFSCNPLHLKLMSMEKKTFEDEDLKVLFTNSSMVKEEILSHYATSPEKIEVIHNGVEWQMWANAFEESFHPPKKGPFHLLFVGNGYKRKGLLFLLQGLELLKKEEFQLTVIGKDKNLSFFVDWASKKGLNDKIHFLGPQENILPYYQKADALVIPSIYDPFANVTVEALAMGLYVVSSAYNGGKEILQKETGAVIEDLTSTASMASALRKAFAHPKKEANARKIRNSIKELDFSTQLDKIVQKTLKTV